MLGGFLKEQFICPVMPWIGTLGASPEGTDIEIPACRYGK
jgi:hypothetical protein